MPTTPTLSDVVGVLNDLYDPELAESWDAVGTVTGRPDQPIGSILFAVDPADAVVAEAIAGGADLIVAHHPLMLRGVTSVAADTPKGRVVHELIGNDIALHVAHTNADSANPGVSDALAAAVGVVDTRPLVPRGSGAHTSNGAAAGAATGLGRVGSLAEPATLQAFAERVAAALPATAQGVRVSGDSDRTIRTVAVCGGSGDSELDTVRRLGADAYLTADLRHHPATEARAYADAPALLDVAHWASEWPWLPVAAAALTERLEQRGMTVATRVSTLVTDAWTTRVGGQRGGDQ